ncbi:MAG: DUF128 domain-containing protein [Spartobacteria bacterium]|nr:DUF128 domain-containing protein [Spartobacteria bacterium]
MSDRQTKKKLAILSILKSTPTPLSGARIAAELANGGSDMSERTIRLYLHQMDSEGLTENKGKLGRIITEQGLSELSASNLNPRMGILSAKIDQMTYRMGFDLASRSGTVLVNTTIVEPNILLDKMDMICQVFEKGFAMGTLACLLPPGEMIGNIAVPDDSVGFCTVCSITLNGVLLKHRVPTRSRFGGLAEVSKGSVTRFLEMISYDGTSIDPLEIFIRGGMTDYIGAITTGNGKIGASFREIPSDSRELVINLADKLQRIGLGACCAIGHPGQPVLDIAVNEGCIGAVVIGGLNPVAILEESGHRAHSRALSGLIEFNRLMHYSNLKDAVRDML